MSFIAKRLEELLRERELLLPEYSRLAARYSSQLWMQRLLDHETLKIRERILAGAGKVPKTETERLLDADPEYRVIFERYLAEKERWHAAKEAWSIQGYRIQALLAALRSSPDAIEPEAGGGEDSE